MKGARAILPSPGTDAVLASWPLVVLPVVVGALAGWDFIVDVPGRWLTLLCLTIGVIRVVVRRISIARNHVELFNGNRLVVVVSGRETELDPEDVSSVDWQFGHFVPALDPLGNDTSIRIGLRDGTTLEVDLLFATVHRQRRALTILGHVMHHAPWHIAWPVLIGASAVAWEPSRQPRPPRSGYIIQ